MKALQNAAVFGLVPVPPLPDTYEGKRDRAELSDMPEDADGSKSLRPSRSAMSRMATQDELARLRDELAASAIEAPLGSADRGGPAGER